MLLDQPNPKPKRTVDGITRKKKSKTSLLNTVMNMETLPLFRWRWKLQGASQDSINSPKIKAPLLQVSTSGCHPLGTTSRPVQVASLSSTQKPTLKQPCG